MREQYETSWAAPDRWFHAEAWRRVLLPAGAMLCAEFLAILVINGGHFNFALDDPYIHLAMAEEILHGHYGINPGEPAAAASSILFPVLLAPFVAIGLGQFSALLVNVAAFFAMLSAAIGLLGEVRVPVGRIPGVGFAVTAVLLGLNLVGLVFLGLEHVLQVADALFCLWGLLRYLDSRRVPPWWIAALVAAPLIRYEGMALLAAGVAVLAIRREWVWAAIAGFTGFFLAALFSLFLLGQGLAPLPSSVLLKSDDAAAGIEFGLAGFISSAVATVGRNMQDPRAVFFLLPLILLCASFVGEFRDRKRLHDWADRSVVALFCSLVLIAQLALGRYAFFARYEIYAIALGVAGLAVVYRDAFCAALSGTGLRGTVYFSAGFVLLFVRFAAVLPATVLAANNIYEQQYQMHRFVTEVYRAPVAVNDLGWVSYRNPSYVLDLMGLGSDAVRRIKATRPETGEWMQSLAEGHDVKLAMIFPEWIAPIPCGWVAIGELRLGRTKVSVPVDHVTFYAIPPGDPEIIRKQIESFRPSLPRGVDFIFSAYGAPNPYCVKAGLSLMEKSGSF